MQQALAIFADYASAFEHTYMDDDWSRLAQYFVEDAQYEVRGGPMACTISGREAIFRGLKKSLDGMDRRCSQREINLTGEPQVSSLAEGEELRLGWEVTYHYGDAPPLVLPGRSVFVVAGGLISSMRDEYDEAELVEVFNWMQRYGRDLDGSYV